MKVEEASCSNCEAFTALVADLQAVSLTEQLESLQEQLAKAKEDSSTSSNPPSSDIVKPNKTTAKGTRRRGKRKQGGQQRHPRHERPRFPLDMLDGAWEYRVSACLACGNALLPSDETPNTLQQIEIIQKSIRIDEHRGLAY